MFPFMTAAVAAILHNLLERSNISAGKQAGKQQERSLTIDRSCRFGGRGFVDSNW